MTTSSDPPATFLTEFLEKHANAAQITRYCALCPDWSVEGTVGETRALAEEHRRDEHPETFGRRRTRAKRVFSQALSAERHAEIEEERRQRMRSMGIG